MSNLPRQPRTTTPATDDAEYRALLKRASLETKQSQKHVLALVDASVDALNRLQAEGDLTREKIGDHLFRVLLANDTALAFLPATEQPAAYLLVKRRVGASLDLEGTEFNLSVRIAALNQLVPEDAWQKLRWSKKKLLARLVERPDDLKALRAGVKKANGVNVGVRALQAWCRTTYGMPDEGSDAPNAGPTLATGRRIVRQALPISSKESRAVLVRRIADAPPDVRDEIVDAYRKLAADAAEFVKEIERYGR